MLKTPGFFEREKDAPIFLEEDGFLERAGDSVYDRANAWYEATFDGAEHPAADSTEDAARLEGARHPRIVLRDSERTFLVAEDREALARLLTRLHIRFEDYSQGMGFVASFLLLFLEPAKTEEIIRCVNSDPKFIPGYWKNEAVGFATDAYVFGHLLAERHPRLAQHLDACYMQPEMYCQKWFTALCVHVLPYEYVFDFFDGFFRHGFKYLFQFALALTDALEDRLLATTNPGELLALLRLDREVFDTPLDYAAVLAAADTIDVDHHDYKALREEMFEKHLRPRMERARRAAEEDSDDEIVFSSEDEEDDK